MPLDPSETVVDRARRMRGSLAGVGDPRAARITVDGPCPAGDCGAHVVADVRADTTAVTCPGCGTAFPL